MNDVLSVWSKIANFYFGNTSEICIPEASVVEPKLFVFYLAPAPTFKKFPLRLRLYIASAPEPATIIAL